MDWEAPYRFMFEASPSGIAVVGLDGVATHCNPALQRILGYSDAELRAFAVLDVTPGSEEASLFNDLIRGACDRYEIDKSYAHKDGRVVWTKVSVTAMRGDDGAPRSIVCTVEDVTNAVDERAHRERIAEEARQSEDRLSLAMTAADMGVWEWDLASDAVRWTEGLERIAGLSPGGFGGTLAAFLDLVTPEDHETARGSLQTAIQTRRDLFEAEYRIRRPDGTLRWVATRGRVFRVDGQPERVLGVAVDVSNRRLLERQILQAQKMEAMGRLAGGVAHDFNNLLTAISGYGEFVINKMDGNDGRRADVQEILNAADRATSLTRQLLAFSRKQVLAPKIVNPNDVVAAMEKMLNRIIGSDIEMRVTLAPATGTVRVDPTQLEQVLLNLAVNARDAMPRGGVLTIETSAAVFSETVREFGIALPPGRYVVLTVGDTGLGMTPETRARLFEPFFTTKEEGRGTGLGLATVLGIVHQSGGAIGVQSAPNEGALFKVYLPWVGEAADPADAVAQPTASIHGSETVLFVDDDSHVRRLGERALRSCGYRVFTFAAGADALAFVTTADIRPDLLVTDIVMPQMPGPVLSARMREVIPTLTVLYITGYTDRAIEPGETSDVLRKPFTPSGLLRTVRDLLDR